MHSEKYMSIQDFKLFKKKSIWIFTYLKLYLADAIHNFK